MHEWWIPADAFRTYCLGPSSDCGSIDAECGVLVPDSAITTIDPNEIIRTVYLTDCLAPDSDCGSVLAECGGIINTGTLLVNKGPEVASFIFEIYCLAPDSDCGSTEAECGIVIGLIFIPIFYPIPQDEEDWRFFIYAGGQTFGDFVDVPAELQGEFERLLLGTLPYQQWIGLLINYV